MAKQELEGSYLPKDISPYDFDPPLLNPTPEELERRAKVVEAMDALPTIKLPPGMTSVDLVRQARQSFEERVNRWIEPKE